MHRLEWIINTLNYYENTRDQWHAQTSGGAGAKRRNEGTIVDWGGGWLGLGDMAKISQFFFRNITIHNFITILCHVGFSILQVV